MSLTLPVTVLRPEFLRSIARGPVVLSSPTGSGKSTEVPRWCGGRVLVVEPRRIACRSLAARVSELEGSPLGETVGYVVRDEHVASADTRIVFATPGMVLRNRSLLSPEHTVILDEFHERSLETDLLLALLLCEPPDALVIMSATLEGERVAKHVGGVHLTAEGRSFPVEVRYLPGHEVLPDARDLPARVQQALTTVDAPGDVLVFLPGKAEITACGHALRGPFEVIPLHGGLDLKAQSRAFENSSRRKVILATNVAETSLTLPGVGVVIDAGLVRQTRYQDGRGFLTLTAIAEDSAAQRAGRAGRTGPGVCIRLWSSAAKLALTTLPEIHRESLVPLVLTAAAWGKQVETLPLLDAPKAYALEAARADLAAWGALQADASLTACGRDLFGLPIDAQYARLLFEARREGCLEDMIDLVAVLAVGRPLFTSSLAASTELGMQENLRQSGCDASAAIRALRAPRAADYGASDFVVHEATLIRNRLRQAQGLENSKPQASERKPLARDELVRAALAADRRLAHVARVRGGKVFFCNGGTELELARDSAVNNLHKVEAILALDTRAFGAGREARVVVTCALAIPISALLRAGFGEERTTAVRVENKRVVVTLERTYANRVLGAREAVPAGAAAQSALLELLLRGSVFRDAIATTRDRLVQTAVADWLSARATGVKVTGAKAATPAPAPNLESWLQARIQELGFESGDDLALLSAGDFLAPPVAYEMQASIESDYPLSVRVGDASYLSEYDLERSQVTLKLQKGSPKDPPALGYLPKFPGLRIASEGPKGLTILRVR